MKHSITTRTVVSIIVPVVVVAIVVAGMAVAVTRDSGGSDAMTIDGTSVSQAKINREFKALASSGVYSPSTSGALTSTDSAQWLTAHVEVVALEKLFAENDVNLTAKQRTALLGQLRKQYSGLPSSAESVLIDLYLANSLLGDKLNGGAAVAAAVTKEVRKLDVTVDPKYGRWVRARAEVCPVAGCAAQSTQSSGSGG